LNQKHSFENWWEVNVPTVKPPRSKLRLIEKDYLSDVFASVGMLAEVCALSLLKAGLECRQATTGVDLITALDIPILPNSSAQGQVSS